ncbi:fluoride efflux transporter CrcB [Pseudonocardia pini]|uniref:fluoride efflux transporter CrcB n=1 Tax=Pseudonocardia pini TaxID=2758030 RepID=UPI0015F0EE62|nr:fluoride efflux transporter CrcB [Pseudonocardia pini]
MISGVLRGQGRPVAAAAAGGAVGALARWTVGLGLPAAPGTFPLGTFLINVVGCLAIGALVEVLTTRPSNPLLRPFLATGVLGGFTTFSTYAVDVAHLLLAGHPGTGLLYLAGTLLAALAATWAGRGAVRWFR